MTALLAAFRSSVRARLELSAEILALHHQLAVLQRQAPRRPPLGRADRLLWVLLSRPWPNWRRAIQIVTPDTVVRWHRRGFGLYWRWRSSPRRPGRPAVAADVRALIRQMQAANPLWGRAAHPRRATKAGHRDRPDDRGQGPPPPPRKRALTDVACLPRQSRLPARLDRLLHRPDRDLPRLVRLCRPGARPTAHRPPERDRASDRRLDRPTAARGLAP